MMKISAKPHGTCPGTATPSKEAARASVADITRHARTRLLIDVDESAGEGVRVELPERGLAGGRAQSRAERRVTGQPLDAPREALHVSGRVRQRVHAVGDELLGSSGGADD